MNKLKSLTFAAAFLTGTAMTLAPALAAPGPTANPQPAARPVQPKPVDCPAELPIARLRWNWNHGNKEVVIQFLRRCFPELLDSLPPTL